jgi:hypothetical protein
MIQQDQQINDGKEKSIDGNSSHSSSYDPSSTNQPRIRIQFKYDNGKLFVMVRYATNLVRKT